MRKIWTKEEDHILRTTRNELKPKELALLLNRSIASIRNRISCLRLPRVWNAKHYVNHDYFEVLTEESAYWLGFIFADGYIDSSPLEENKKSRYGFEISLKGSDAEHLHKFNEFMGHNKDNVKIVIIKFFIFYLQIFLLFLLKKFL